MNDLKRYQLEKKYVPLIDKYCISLFIIGLVCVFFKLKDLGIFFVFSFFLVKLAVITYTMKYSVVYKIKKKRLAEEKRLKEIEELKKIDTELNEVKYEKN